MATYTYEVYGGNGIAPGFLLSEYNSIVLNTGRQQVQDPFKAGTAVVTGRNLSNVTNLNIGDYLTIRISAINGTAVSYTVFSGKIADITADYGINSNADSWTIYAEDFLADLGRLYITDSWPAGITASAAAAVVVYGTGIGLSYVITYAGQSKVSAQSFTNENALNIFNTLLATEQGRLVSAKSLLATDIEWFSRDSINYYGTLCNFTDGSVASALPAVKFEQIQFRSRADSYFTKTIIEPEGLASQSSGTGDRVFTSKTYDETTAQAQNLADYVLATLDVSQDVPAKITFMAESQTTASAELGLRCFLDGPSATRTFDVTLRGTVYSVFVEGAMLSATPSETRFSLNLSSSEAAVGFILDDEVFGVLDTSKLGF